jgi:zinc transporter, ZIP family
VSEATKLVLLRALIAVIAAAIGGIIGIGWKKPSHKALCALVSFAAGALLSVTVVDIMPDAIALSGWGLTVGATVIGVVFFYLIGKYVSYVCPACAASAMEHQNTYLRLGILLMVALGIHSTVDGLGIALSSQTGLERLAILILFAVSYHKVPEGLALVSVARLAGVSRWKSLALTILIELTTGLGAFIGLAIVHVISQHWLGFHLGLVAGSFIYIVGFALITEMQEHERKSIIAYLILGFVLILLTSYILTRAGIGGG